MSDYRNRCANDRKCKIAIKDVDKSARALCQSMAAVNGQSMGEVISEALWEHAIANMNSTHIKRVLKQENIEFTID